MTAQNCFEAFTELLPPRPGSGLAVDWAAVEEAWGLEFPSDYKNLIARYGDVLLGDYLQVIAPTTVTPETCDEPGAPRGGMGFITADARETWAETEPTAIEAEPEELVTWGAASSADLFCWLTRGEPDKWAVMVFSHGDDIWTQYDFGTAEFLVRVLNAQPGVEAMKETPLWGDRNSSYVNSAERRRARGKRIGQGSQSTYDEGFAGRGGTAGQPVRDSVPPSTTTPTPFDERDCGPDPDRADDGPLRP